MATKSYISNNQDVIQRFTNAIYKGQKWVDENSAQDIAEVIAPHFSEFDVSDLSIMVERYKNQGTWRSNPAYDEDDFELFQDIMEEGGELSNRVPFEKLIDNSFAEKAINSVE